ncbi:uncharacterized protein AKAW2_20606A [Aspergillus luchuensis]|uniref:Similar to An01g04770 n=1 Tax=Aspergillus kawachii TaxID=1069201 RepID=A0A146FPQ8_ASPKA|nr:uncharacterized protein AKAW2_20606A [Aspergillus luchuensis]BCR95666.1 hypothetical protein AKAW2_20606A [Aspergillus luchuensis]BCS08204.1 hypothetical protein ALUC_20574A [Aspergillus luchuensis]GAA83443.1 similar to An01g04770 [Aspergillus luchuensis IFO 4308]GAT27319.1 similar to An01g04770 [Aspergillus luchuensis]
MAEQFTSLVNTFGGLSFADGTSNRSNPTQDLLKTIRALVTSCQSTSANTAHVGTVIEGTQTPSGEYVARLSTLRREAVALAKTTKRLSDATENYIMAYLTSLASPWTLEQKMLSHFSDEVKRIAGNVLDDETTNESSVMRRILEECYAQALCDSGTLHPNKYFKSLEETSFEEPYDPDFESGEYYEHENRLAIDDSYAEAYRVQCERKAERKEQQREEWIGFWVRALSKCPDEPTTLFYPPASRLPNCHLAEVPRYLFRAFDEESSGRSDHHVVASAESISAELERSRTDLLSRPPGESTRMLYNHLKWFKSKDADNLMSWSGSLLYVIQYAIWRCNKWCRDPAEVYICIVDTRKFPRGQFARDKSLLRVYRDAPEVDPSMRSFFDFRLRKNPDYDNGEYLSQGVLHHAGRSSVVSLEQLIQAGLYDLYPEFADASERDLWAKRVEFLRSAWSKEHMTTRLDIQHAVNMARECFNGFNALDIALVLLTLKERKLLLIATMGPESRKIYRDLGPDEVQRYTDIMKNMMAKGRGIPIALFAFATDRQLEEIFECS